MTNIDDTYQKLAALKAKYNEPGDREDFERLEQDEARISKLLQTEEFYNHPVMKDLLAVCRRDVVMARRKLATDRTLDDDERGELWKVIDARLWFIERASQNYRAELDAMDQELEAVLARF